MQQSMRIPCLTDLHLATRPDQNVRRRFLPHGPRVLYFAHDIHAVDHLAEDHMLVVQERGWDCRDEELGAVGVGAGVLVFGPQLFIFLFFGGEREKRLGD